MIRQFRGRSSESNATACVTDLNLEQSDMKGIDLHQDRLIRLSRPLASSRDAGAVPRDGKASRRHPFDGPSRPNALRNQAAAPPDVAECCRSGTVFGMPQRPLISLI